MREHQSHQSTGRRTDTEQMAESTMNQGQQTIEQLIDLQRNMARMTLSAIEWQETAQRQGLELTKSLLESAPGPKFTESMMQSYLQGMEAVVPEMERAMERGMHAAAESQSQPLPQTGMGRSERTSEGGMSHGEPSRQDRAMAQYGRGRTGDQPTQAGGAQTGQRETSGSMGGQHRTPSQGPSERRMDEPRSHEQGQPRTHSQGQHDHGQDTQPQPRVAGRQGSSDRPQPHESFQESRQYPQTGEWISPGEYGGEPAGEPTHRNRPMTAQPGRSRESESHQYGGRFGQEDTDRRSQPQSSRLQAGGPQGATEHGGPSQGSGQPPRGREDERPAQGRESPGRTQQGRIRDQYSERIDSERQSGGEPQATGGRGRKRQRDNRGQFASREPDTDRGDERAPDRRAQTESSETDQMEEMDVSPDGSDETTEPRSGHEKQSEETEE